MLQVLFIVNVLGLAQLVGLAERLVSLRLLNLRLGLLKLMDHHSDGRHAVLVV